MKHYFPLSFLKEFHSVIKETPKIEKCSIFESSNTFKKYFFILDLKTMKKEESRRNGENL